MTDKEELLRRVKQFIARAGDVAPDGADEQAKIQGKKKLEQIFVSYNGDVESLRKANAIKEFIETDEIKRDMLYNFCFDMHNGNVPTAPTAQKLCVYDSGTVVEFHRALDEDDLEKLYKFIKARKDDKTFGDAVYEIMDKHGMKPPDVYHNGLLRRQDFSRVTGPNCKGLKKTTVWSIIIGLHCDKQEADYLFHYSGESKRDTVFDLVLEYMITTKNYDVIAINEVLYELKQPLLSCYMDSKPRTSKKNTKKDGKV